VLFVQVLVPDVPRSLPHAVEALHSLTSTQVALSPVTDSVNPLPHVQVYPPALFEQVLVPDVPRLCPQVDVVLHSLMSVQPVAVVSEKSLGASV
jgi:hypothetical protein